MSAALKAEVAKLVAKRDKEDDEMKNAITNLEAALDRYEELVKVRKRQAERA